MVEWSDPAVIQSIMDFFCKSLLSTLGLYAWEVIMTFDFEQSFFNSFSKREWQWYHLCYFVCRYSFLIALILLNITLNTSLPVNCQGMYTVNQLLGNVSIGTASLNLAFRALAIWRNHRGLTVIMGILAAGHWSILFYCATTLSAAQNTTGEGPPCTVIGVNRRWLVALYVYTMAFDTFIMVTCLLGLWNSRPRNGGRGRELYRLLWTDGLVYFICASVANTVPVVFYGLDLNPAMDIVSTVASACITTIMSCRAVQRLNAWGTNNATAQEPGYKMDTPVGRHVENRKTYSIVITQTNQDQ